MCGYVALPHLRDWAAVFYTAAQSLKIDESAPGGSRTHNLGLRRASLYPLSYWGERRNYTIQGPGMPWKRRALHTGRLPLNRGRDAATPRILG